MGIDAFHRREQVFDHSICSFSRCWGVFLLANLCLAGKSICCFIVTLTRRSNQKLLPKAEEMQTGWLLVQFARTVRRRLSKEERRKRSIPVEVGEKKHQKKRTRDDQGRINVCADSSRRMNRYRNGVHN